jgi:hypothetical protein
MANPEDPNPHCAPGYEEVTPLRTAEIVTDKPGDQIQQTEPPKPRGRDKEVSEERKEPTELQETNPRRRPES